ncbi:MAG: hypothetical protein U1E33_05565 [Rhodospirillales bacterium]
MPIVTIPYRSFPLPALLALAVAALMPAAARAQAGAVVPLPAQMQATAQQYLPGVVGQPVPAFTIDPAMASLNAGTRQYQIVSGPNAGNIENHVIAPVAGDTTGTKWRYTVGDRSVFLQLVPGQSLNIVTEDDGDQGVSTRYSPPEPLLVAGMNAGDSTSATLNVNVYDLSDPSDLEHQGSLNVTLTYVGAYQVTVPAGTYNAALLKWTFDGQIGPASVQDTQARFVVPGVGMVAGAEKRDVAAFLIYNDNTKVGKVLAQQP